MQAERKRARELEYYLNKVRPREQESKDRRKKAEALKNKKKKEQKKIAQIKNFLRS